MNDLPAEAVTPPATAAYFAATADGPFDHQRDAYEQGYEDGRAQAAAAERERIRQLAEEHDAAITSDCSCPQPHTAGRFADLLRDQPQPAGADAEPGEPGTIRADGDELRIVTLVPVSEDDDVW